MPSDSIWRAKIVVLLLPRWEATQIWTQWNKWWNRITTSWTSMPKAAGTNMLQEEHQVKQRLLMTSSHAQNVDWRTEQCRVRLIVLLHMGTKNDKQKVHFMTNNFILRGISNHFLDKICVEKPLETLIRNAWLRWKQRLKISKRQQCVANGCWLSIIASKQYSIMR